MAIVPSGKRKLMKLQQSYQVTDQNKDATQTEVTNDSSQKQPQQQQQKPAFDFNQLQQNMQNQNVSGPVPSAEELQGAVEPKVDSSVQSPGDVTQKMDDLGTKGNNMRSFIFGLLEDLGAPTTKLLDDPDTFFQGVKDLDTGKISGSYFLPSYTKNNKITQDRAEQIARQIGEKFNLSQKLQPVGNNYKITYLTREDPTAMQTGSSFDEMGSQKAKGSGGGGGGMAMGKAASVSRGMQKDRTNSLFDGLLKQLGEKNG